MIAFVLFIVVLVSVLHVVYPYSPLNRIALTHARLLSTSSTAIRLTTPSNRPVPADEVQSNQALQEYLKGNLQEPWKGTREILKRKKQIPSPDYCPQQVVVTCLDALQSNDDPQLDHGSCVVLEFKSPNGQLAQSNLDPAGYGRFLRTTEYEALLDFKEAILLGEPTELQDSLSVKQKVEVKGWSNANGSSASTFFDFYLSKIGQQWLIDLVLLSK